MITPRFIPIILVLAFAAGCGKSDGKKPAATCVARVNGDEITIHQINNVLGRSGQVAPERAEEAKRQVLERLIDQQLAKQQAIEKKLDRTPVTTQAIEAARADILARAYLEQLAAAQKQPSDEEIRKYYAEHPELFAQRRIFNIEEIGFSRKDDAAAGVKTLAANASLADIAGSLKAKNVQFAENRGVRAAEQVPLEWLPRLHRMKEGEIQVFESGERVSVIRMVAAKPAPVDEARAKQPIQQFLFNRRLRDAITAEVAGMREKSNIEYMGEFARAPGAKPAAAPETFQPAPEPTPPAKPDLDKGLRGLR